MPTERMTNSAVTIDHRGELITGDRATDGRARRLITRLVEERFRSEVSDWAAADTGGLRTRLTLRVEIAREIETLVVALGGWAFVDSDEIFPPANQRPDSPFTSDGFLEYD